MPLVIDHLTQEHRTAVGGQMGDLEFMLLRKFTIKHTHILDAHTDTFIYHHFD